MQYESCHFYFPRTNGIERVGVRYEHFHADGPVDANGKWRQRHPYGEDVQLQYIRPLVEEGEDLGQDQIAGASMS